MADSQLSLGDYLRQEREKRGITIEQVASATKIAVRLLHSLESNHFDELPAKPFIRGFVISYARFVGLDPKEVLNHYDPFLEKKSHERPVRASGHSGYVFEKREGEQTRTMLWLVMGGFVVFGGLVMIFLKPTLRHRHQTQIEKLKSAYPSPVPSDVDVVAQAPVAAESPVAPTPPLPEETAHAPIITEKPPSVPAPAKTTEAITNDLTKDLTKDPKDPKDPLNSGKTLKAKDIHHKIIFKALGSVWVRYKVDERPPTRFILRKGSVLVLRAEKGIQFQTSNPKYLLYNYNSAGEKLLAESKNVILRYGGGTLLIPSEPLENIGDLFPGWGAIPTSEPPPSPKQSSLSPE